jgi:hypothetical protein
MIAVFASALDKWDDVLEANQTMPTFQHLFNKENTSRIAKLPVQTAGFHGAHQAVVVPPSPPQLGLAAAATNTPLPRAPFVDAGHGIRMYYCWSHGLGINKYHTSTSCKRPREGHQKQATITNMIGGNNTIYVSRPHPRPHPDMGGRRQLLLLVLIPLSLPRRTQLCRVNY